MKISTILLLIVLSSRFVFSQNIDSNSVSFEVDSTVENLKLDVLKAHRLTSAAVVTHYSAAILAPFTYFVILGEIDQKHREPVLAFTYLGAIIASKITGPLLSKKGLMVLENAFEKRGLKPPEFTLQSVSITPWDRSVKVTRSYIYTLEAIENIEKLAVNRKIDSYSCQVIISF